MSAECYDCGADLSGDPMRCGECALRAENTTLLLRVRALEAAGDDMVAAADYLYVDEGWDGFAPTLKAWQELRQSGSPDAE